MNTISFDDFYSRYKVKRNPVKLISNYENTMLDMDEEELDELEDHPLESQWTLLDNKDNLILKPGRICSGNSIGFFICKEKWSKNEEGYILQ